MAQPDRFDDQRELEDADVGDAFDDEGDDEGDEDIDERDVDEEAQAFYDEHHIS